MQLIRLGRISAVVTALTLIGALHHSDAIAAMVSETDDEVGFDAGQTRVDLRRIGVLAILQIPYVNGRSAPAFGPMTCGFDARAQQELCLSRRPTDSTFAFKAVVMRSADGHPQSAFDQRSTDAVIERSAFVRAFTDQGGHPTQQTFRSNRQYRGMSRETGTVTLRGADTTYGAVRRGTGTNRMESIVYYGDVQLPHGVSSGSEPGYPMAGVIFATGHHEWVTSKSTRPFNSTIVVYFDGTSTPDAYLDGRRHHLDLRTGVATPYAD